MVTVRLTPPKKVVFRISLVLGIIAIIIFFLSVLIADWTYGFIHIPIPYIDWLVFTLALHLMLFAFMMICAGAAFKGF